MSSKHLGYVVDLEPKRCGLSASEKSVLTQLAQAANSETGECWPSRDFISRRAGVSVDTVDRCLPVLEAKGYLSINPNTRENGSHTSHTYTVHLHQLAAVWEWQQSAIEAEKKGRRRGGKTVDKLSEGGRTMRPGWPHHAEGEGRTMRPGIAAPCGPHNQENITKIEITLARTDAREGEASLTKDKLRAILVGDPRYGVGWVGSYLDTARVEDGVLVAGTRYAYDVLMGCDVIKRWQLAVRPPSIVPP